MLETHRFTCFFDGVVYREMVVGKVDMNCCVADTSFMVRSSSKALSENSHWASIRRVFDMDFVRAASTNYLDSPASPSLLAQ